MALKTLMLRKKLDDKQKALAGSRAAAEELQKREAELESAIAEAETDEEKEAVSEAVTSFEAEKAENDKQTQELEGEIDAIEKELAESEAKQAESRKTPEMPEIRKDAMKVMKRTKFFGMTMQERDAFFADEEVKSFLERARECGRQKRSLSGADFTIPTVMLSLIRENIEAYSKLISKVNLVDIPGEGRQNIMGAIPEAVWTEMCASLNEIDLSFAQTEVDGYKVGAIITICNATLEDSDIALASEIITALGKAIGIALDKAIVYGTGTKMPLGIVPRLVQTAKPSTYGNNDRAWKDLHTSNVITIASTTKALELFKEIIKASGSASSDYSNGSLVWIMNRKTKTAIIAEAMNINAAGVIASGINNTMPVVGGDIVELNFLPDNVIVAGYADNYLLVQRAGTKIGSSDHIKFIEDQTVFKGTARYDGKPVIAEAFVAIGINGTTPTGNAVSFTADAANTVAADEKDD